MTGIVAPSFATLSKQLKVSVWFDAGIGAGSSFDREIEREIEAAKALLVLWTEESVESDWVRNEARTGKERSGLIAVQLRECQLPLEFRSVQGGSFAGRCRRHGMILSGSALLPGSENCWSVRVWRNMPGWKNPERLTNGKTGCPAFSADPLAPGVIDNIIERANPDVSKELAGERAKRSAIEAELSELTIASKAQSGEVATGAREMVRLRTRA